jgi:hypothetical protein
MVETGGHIIKVGEKEVLAGWGRNIEFKGRKHEVRAHCGSLAPQGQQCDSVAQEAPDGRRQR